VIVAFLIELHSDDDLGEKLVAIPPGVEAETIRAGVEIGSEVSNPPVVVGDF
jgi:hypothetical protein